MQVREWRRRLASSDSGLARGARGAKRAVGRFSLPLPRWFLWPIARGFEAARGMYWFGKRVLVCEPYLKAHCAEYGRGVRTDVYLHWFSGAGELRLGDGVLIDGKCSFHFAARFVDRPALVIGEYSEIGHNCSFDVAKEIRIGRGTHIASDVWVFDSSGHPADPEARKAGKPPDEREVRPVRIGDNVWIGRRCIIFPGVTVGDNSIVSAGSVVMQDVAANSVVAGNPARKIKSLLAEEGRGGPAGGVESSSAMAAAGAAEGVVPGPKAGSPGAAT